MPSSKKVIFFLAAALGILACVITPGIAISAPASPDPTLEFGRGTPVRIEVADRILRARAPKARRTALKTTLIVSKAKLQSKTIKGHTALTLVACSGTGQPVEIATLAASLKCDPDLIFEYVYNNIEYEPLYGSNKGALGTLLDLRGDDIDQAQLFAALLNAAGYSSSQVNFIYGYVRLTGAQASSWLGVKNDAQAILNVFSNGGIPTANATQNPDHTLYQIDVAQVWVQVNIGGTNYVFDPSFKLHTVSIGLSSLGTILGYTQSQFLTDAGSTIDSTGISNINRAKVRSDLTGYAANLVSYIKGNNPAWSMSDVVGGKTIQYLTGSPLRQTSLPIQSPSQPSGFPMNWGSSIPNAYRTCFTISMPGVANQNCAAATSQNILLYSDQTYGHRITIFSTGSTCAPPSGSCTPTLLIDGALPPNGQNTGTAASFGNPWNVNVSITHPYTGSLATQANQTKTLVVNSGGSYLIADGWGQVSRGMIEKHRTLLSQALAAGGSSSSEPVLGETLAIMGYSWLAECAEHQRLSDAIGKITTQYHHGVGIMAQAVIQATGDQGPYIDVPMNVLTLQPQTNYTGSGLPPSFIATAYADSGASSSLESAILEQTQGFTAGMQAASTVRLVDMNVATSAKTFFADGTTSTGLATYFSTIRPSLTGYGTTDLAYIDDTISTNGMSSGSPTGNQVLIPIKGNISVGAAPWTGAGYTISTLTSSSLAITQKISGGLSGGFSGFNIPTLQLVPSAYDLSIPPLLSPSISSGTFSNQFSYTDPLTTEPVDTITGAYTYNHSDLVIGSGSFPYSLSFSRNYGSASNSTDLGLGKGWVHNYDISVLRTSDPYAGMGEASPISAAAAIAAVFVTQDLFGGTVDAQHTTLGWVTDRWLTDQLTNNAVSVNLPNTSEEYIWLPHNDGSSTISYNAPFGSAVSLTGSSPDAYSNMTVFNYLNKDQSKLTFNTLNSSLVSQVANWTMPYGVNVAFTYGYSYGGNTYLSTVSNNLGRIITLSYSGAHVTGVSDGSGRSMSYTYDGNNNLSTFIDPLGFQTAFAYDGSASHLTQIFYPTHPSNAFVTNTYDALGKVSQQANANGYTTNFYLAGSRSEIIDPANDRHVTYQTARGSVLKDDYVLSGTADIFNDTIQQNGVVDVIANQYDGQARLTLTTAPEGGTTGYSYSLDLLQNILQVVNTPKSGSPLSPLTTTYTYDPLYNKPTSVTDPLGLVTASSYDSATGNLLRTVADAGSGSHLNATTNFTYNSVGQLLTKNDAVGVVTLYSYDSFGNSTAVTRDYGTGHLNQLTSVAYNSRGDPTSITDPNGNVTTSIFDADRRLSSVLTPVTPAAPSGLLTAYTYDPDGRVLQTQQSSSGTVLRTTSSTYTPTGKVATSTDARGNATSYAYDTIDRLTTVTDPVSNVTIYGYDAMSRQISLTNAAIQTAPLLQHAFTPDGLSASLTDANNHTTTFAYDGLDRLSFTTYPDSMSDKETLTYDADSNVLSRLTRKGDTISFAYDTLNRLCTKAIATSSTGCGATSGNPTTFYAYDLVGHTTGVSDNSASMTAPSSSVAGLTVNATYDALNHPLTTGWTPAATQTAPTASGITFTHSYDANNRRIGQTATDNSWFNYPTTASSVSYTTNSLNQYSGVGSVTPIYDGNGNLTYDGTNTYTYNAESRLTKIQQGATTIATYAYDGQGRRKSKSVGSTTTIFVTDADNREVLEYNGTSGATQRWYSYGQGSNDVLNQMNVAAATRATLIPDIQGSIVGSLSSGGTLTKIGYQPFGENSSLTSGTFNYTAQRFDAETAGSAAQPSGLYYYRARMYSPTWGRFLQVDPAGYVAGENLFTYVADDPLNHIDQTGLWLVSIGVVGTGSGFVTGGGEVGIAFGTGGFSTYTSLSLGSGGGEQVELGGHLGFSPTGSISNVGGVSGTVGVSGGEGIVGGLDVNTDLLGNRTYGLTLGAGGGTPVSVSAGAAYTGATCLTCGSYSQPYTGFPPAPAAPQQTYTSNITSVSLSPK